MQVYRVVERKGWGVMSVTWRSPVCYVLLGLLLLTMTAGIAGCECGTGTDGAILEGGQSVDGAQIEGAGSDDSAVQAITENWLAFFDGSIPASSKVSLLENGEQHQGELAALAASPIGSQLSAQVASVNVTSGTTAVVTYSVLVGGNALAQNQTGNAVLNGGTWQVSEQTLALIFTIVPIPSAPSGSSGGIAVPVH
jgi:hypothetical protein